MPRIAHVISTASGIAGAERVLAALVEEGERQGWDQTVLNPFAREAGADLARICSPAAFEAFECARVTRLPAMRSWLKSRLRSFEPDIVHTHLFHALVAVASIRRGIETRLLTHHHGEYLRVQNRRFGTILDRRAGTRFDHIVAVSQAGRDFLVNGYGYQRDEISVILNGWSGTPRDHKGSPTGNTVVSVGNLRPEKGQDVLIAAFARLSVDFPDARLVLVGEGPSEASLRRQVKDLEIAERVNFTGAVLHPWVQLADADVFAAPSRSEALGIATIEAMAAGLPVVASSVGGLPELVQDGVTGYLVPAGDEHALQIRLSELFRSPDVRQAMGAAGRKAVEPMTMKNMVEDYSRLYERLIAGRLRRG